MKEYKFKINYKTWEIKEEDQETIKSLINKRNNNHEEDTKNISSRFFGLTLTDEQLILLDKDLPDERKRSTLLHELTHCYINSYVTHLDKRYEEEEVADIVSNSFDIIKNVSEDYLNWRKQTKEVKENGRKD